MSISSRRKADESASAVWLEMHEGDAPLLLIAPHGGKAGPVARALLHPKVNDLHTADITRELSGRLGAGALINSGMDRNRLDLNRLSQVMDTAPWMLDLIVRRLERIVERHARATVLLIHGWNVIEPRVDLGVGLKSLGGTLRPPRGAHVSASESFINGALLALSERLHRDGIKVSFGLRYPGGGANNLLQAFTQRHAASSVTALRRLAALDASGALEAVQLELSVALRLPGRLRRATLDALAEVFSRYDRQAFAQGRAQVIIAPAQGASPSRAAPSSGKPSHTTASASIAAPIRVGLELYDPAAQVGAMASFDLGPRAAGARVMVLIGRDRIALFTAEGRVERTAYRLALGPVTLGAEGGRLVFAFHGPAVVVDDGSAYLSVERALARAALHDAMELRAEFEPWPLAQAGTTADGAAALKLLTNSETAAEAIFGRVTGHLAIAGTRYDLSAVARAGRSFTGLGGGGFRARRMVWAAFPDGAAPHAIEARALLVDDGDSRLNARVLDHGCWARHDVRGLEMAPPASTRPPRRISATLSGHGSELMLGGDVRSFVMLSRPGPAQSRIVTSLGFATFNLGTHHGAGMFERSRRSAVAPASNASTAQNDDD
jgi:hypothetical protein